MYKYLRVDLDRFVRVILLFQYAFAFFAMSSGDGDVRGYFSACCLSVSLFTIILATVKQEKYYYYASLSILLTVVTHVFILQLFG